MIVISAGMQKSGTAWYFNLTNDLLTSGGLDNTRQIREQYGLHDIVRYQTCSIGKITPAILERILQPHREGHSFVVKTHKRPADEVLKYIQTGDIRVTYIYRDPRAVALSAYEHGKKMRSEGVIRPFGWIYSVELGILYARKLTSVWRYWQRAGDVLMCRYEDLLSDAAKELQRIADYLSLDVSSDRIKVIVDAYSSESIKDSKNREKTTMHFNQGVADRYRLVFNRRQMKFADLVLGKNISEMGYPRD